ncbi:MAG: hypothetical protein IMZ71_00955 [Chloroflexi bacterium]|nr:hypothetical protein [Chloroflexota bacterium]
MVNFEETLVLLDAIPDYHFTDGIEDAANNRIKPGVAGFYAITGQVTFSNTLANKRYAVYLINSAYPLAYACKNYVHACLDSEITGRCCLPCIYLSAQDYVTLWAVSMQGDNTCSVEGSEEKTFLAVQRVR